MLELTETKIRKWADVLKVKDLRLAELDLRLLEALKAIYSDSFLSERLYLKGGTALNKLYIKETSRLSVDLDFNAIGEKERVLKERKAVRSKITERLKEQDSNYKIGSRSRYELTTIHAIYDSLFGGEKQRIKIEISNIERFAILGRAKKDITIPFSNERFWVSTYEPEELIATKLRALYSRLKGRDIYDLYFASDLELDEVILRKLVIYYFYRSKKIFTPGLLFKNIREKFESRKYVDDVSGFIRSDMEFPMRDAVMRVTSHYSFLSELDERDNNFLALAKRLLNKPVAKSQLRIISEIKHPLLYLFGPDAKISHDANNATIKDIKVFIQPKLK